MAEGQEGEGQSAFLSLQGESPIPNVSKHWAGSVIRHCSSFLSGDAPVVQGKGERKRQRDRQVGKGEREGRHGRDSSRERERMEEEEIRRESSMASHLLQPGQAVAPSLFHHNTTCRSREGSEQQHNNNNNLPSFLPSLSLPMSSVTPSPMQAPRE